MNNVVYDYTSDVYEELEDYKSRCEKALLIIEKQKKKSYIKRRIKIHGRKCN